ncbi:MAG TPA: hypothetical protein VME18_07375 [Acidobacteriaceae bacterium]|nr:hypothetical protein [Acidobacteriaceae bacterium]
MLASVILLVMAVSAHAQGAPPVTDPTALVRHAVALRLAEEASNQPLRFVFHKKDDHRAFTQEIIETPQGDVARLVALNGAPLTPGARQAEANRLHALAANPALQQHRFRHEQADQARIDKLLRLLPQAFVYRYVGSEPCQVADIPEIPIPGAPGPPPTSPPPGDVCYHLTYTPNPRWNPPDLESRILQGMAGNVWIDSTGDRLHRLTAHLIADVDFGWGIVGRLNRGGSIFLEQDRLSGNDWELTHMKLNLTGKVLLVKAIRIDIDESMGDFQPAPKNLDYRRAIHMLLASPPQPSP